ncbi:MAG: hypothetical protein IKY43_01660 [Bacteroidales bacterium]|jgi:hypothetical protein|nr:hypothetical protein [Bacteroidales bacterium]
MKLHPEEISTTSGRKIPGYTLLIINIYYLAPIFSIGKQIPEDCEHFASPLPSFEESASPNMKIEEFYSIIMA